MISPWLPYLIWNSHWWLAGINANQTEIQSSPALSPREHLTTGCVTPEPLSCLFFASNEFIIYNAFLYITPLSVEPWVTACSSSQTCSSSAPTYRAEAWSLWKSICFSLPSHARHPLKGTAASFSASLSPLLSALIQLLKFPEILHSPLSGQAQHLGTLWLMLLSQQQDLGANLQPDCEIPTGLKKTRISSRLTSMEKRGTRVPFVDLAVCITVQNHLIFTSEFQFSCSFIAVLIDERLRDSCSMTVFLTSLMMLSNRVYLFQWSSFSV